MTADSEIRPTRNQSVSLRLAFGLVYLLSWAIVSCDSSVQSQPDSTGIGLAIPRIIAESRGIDLATIRPIVTLGDDREINMIRNGDSWTGSINVTPNTVQTLSIAWWITLDGQDLELANIQQTYNVSADGVDAQLDDSTTYNTDIDTDNDNIANLTELENNTNPFESDETDPLFGVDVLVSRIDPAQAPIIDGLGVTNSASDIALVGEWQNSTQVDRGGRRLYIDRLLIDNVGNQRTGDPVHRWAVTHDGTFLYILVLSDDISAHHSDSNGLENDDGIEIYIDGNNSKTDDYADDDDIYMHIALLEQNSSTNNDSDMGSPRFQKGFFSKPLPEDISFVTGPNAGPLSFEHNDFRQDVYEVRISIAELGIIPGERFGIEIQINDDDDGNTRDVKWAWIHPPLGDPSGIIDQTWKNPGLMGTAILQ